MGFTMVGFQKIQEVLGHPHLYQKCDFTRSPQVLIVLGCYGKHFHIND